MESLWAWALNLALVALLLGVRLYEKHLVWPRVWRSVVWVARHDLGGALTAVAVLVAVGAAATAKGLVKVIDPTAFYIGLTLMGLGLLAAILILGSAVVDRYREETFRHRLSTVASHGRQYLNELVEPNMPAAPPSRSVLDTWAAEVRSLLEEMDPPDVYSQRFDIPAGLPAHEYRLDCIAPNFESERFLRDRLARLSEILRESER